MQAAMTGPGSPFVDSAHLGRERLFPMAHRPGASYLNNWMAPAMTFAFNWGGEAGQLNNNSDWSNIAMPVGEWFDMEMRLAMCTYSARPATLSVWINGQLALQQTGVKTAIAGHPSSRIVYEAVRRRPGAHPLEPDPDHQVRAQRPHLWRTHLAVIPERLLSQRRLRARTGAQRRW